jgi:cell division protein FtsN
MSKHTDSLSLRTAVEKAFAGIAATFIVAFISAGTVAICFPNLA